MNTHGDHPKGSKRWLDDLRSVTTPEQETVLFSDYLRKLRFQFMEECSELGPCPYSLI